MARPVEGQRALAVIDLGFFAGGELEDVEACRGARLEAGDEALDRVVTLRETVAIDQVVVEALGIATEVDLGLDPGPMELTR